MSDLNFINLNTFSDSHEIPSYCAIYLQEYKTSESIFSLTPHVMKWSDQVWLCHIEPCKSYWRLLALKSGLQVDETFQQVLNHSFSHRHLCVFANHPWQALVFLTVLKKRKAFGLYFLNSLLNKKVYKNVSWQDWFEPMTSLATHLIQIKMKGFDPSHFRTQQSKLKRFIQRMNLKGPFALDQAEDAAISRRFSSAIGKIWNWTFHDFQNKELKSQRDLFSWSEPQTDLRGFPWISFELKHPPQISRHLEYPITLWETVEPLLNDDLKKLCALNSWSSHEKVLSLHWIITLYSLEEIVVEISFRHPHALHEEVSTGFKTALYQAHYAYLGLMNQLKKRETDLDLPEEIPFLSWRLKVARRLYQNPQALPFILNKERDQKNSIDYEKILDLQNKLSLPLERYQIHPNFLPEQSFCANSIGDSSPSQISLNQWEFSACKRPLFFFKDPQPLKNNSFSHFHFLERTSQNWWDKQNLNEAHRDYFVLEHQGQLIWAYRTSNKDWFKHGVYS